MRQEDKDYVISVRSERNTKIKAKKLFKIRNEEENTGLKSPCFCSSLERDRFIAEFYIWYDERFI